MSYMCSYLVEKFRSPGVAIIAYKHNASQPNQTPRSHLANSRVNLVSERRQTTRLQNVLDLHRDLLKIILVHVG